MPSDEPGRDPILDLANAQHGAVARQQLIAIGINPGTIDDRLAGGRLTVLYPGVYVVGHSRLTIRGEWMAGVLAGGNEAALSHRSAGAHWGLLRPPPIVEILRAWSPKASCAKTTRSSAPFGKPLRIHRSRVFTPDEYEVRNGIATTSVARTLLDLAAVLSPGQLDSAYTEGERLGIVEIRELRKVLTRGRGWTGIGTLREIVQKWDPASTRTKLELELAFHRLCRKLEIPAPDLNVLVGGMEVDCLWREKSLIIELDSRRYHSDPSAFERDKERSIVLEDLGFRVVRLTYEMVTKHEAKTAARLKSWLT